MPGMSLAFLAAILSLVFVAQAAAATGEPSHGPARTPEKGPGLEETHLYESEENSVLQTFSVVGRYHGQSWKADASQGEDHGWDHRRIYFGFEALLFREWTAHLQVLLSDDLDPVYDGIYQAFVRWSRDDDLSVSVGQVDFLFVGLERSVSSTRIVTFERGLLVNQVLPGEVVGAVAEGVAGSVSYHAGLLSGTLEEDSADREGGFGAVAGVGRRNLHLDYLFNDGNAENNALEPYDHVVSLWHQGQAGRLALGVELIGAHGLAPHPDVFGVTVLPTYVLAKDLARTGDALQAVVRYQFADSHGDNGLQLQERYEQEIVPGGFGDRYQAAYGGLNYLVLGDRIKLMAGAEYAVMHDAANDVGEFRGWTYLAGLRVAF